MNESSIECPNGQFWDSCVHPNWYYHDPSWYKSTLDIGNFCEYEWQHLYLVRNRSNEGWMPYLSLPKSMQDYPSLGVPHA